MTRGEQQQSTATNSAVQTANAVSVTPEDDTQGTQEEENLVYNMQNTNTQTSSNNMRSKLLRYLAHLNSELSDRVVEVLLDSGASKDFMHYDIAQMLCKAFGFRLEQLKDKMSVKLADGSTMSANWIIRNVPLIMGDHYELRDFHVIHLKGIEVILGKPWLYDHNPNIDFVTNVVEFRSAGHRHVLLPSGGSYSSDETSLSLISATEVSTLSAAGEEIGAVFVLHSDADASKYGDDCQKIELSHGAVAYVTSVDSADKPAKVKATPDVAEQHFKEQFKPQDTDTVCMTQQNYDKLVQLIRKHPSVVVDTGELPPKRTIADQPIQHVISTDEGAIPPCKPAYRLAPSEMLELKKQLDMLLEKGYIRPSSSPYGAPVLFAPKKGSETLRMCLDYRDLNAITKKDKYPIPRDSDLFDRLQGAKWFSTCDLMWGYWQVLIHQDSIEKTAIRTPLGSYEWLVMPFGLTNAPSTFQRMMENALRPLLMECVVVFLDDVCIFSENEENHLRDIAAVLELLEKHQLKLKLSKCTFFAKQVKYLGHMVSADGITVDPDKVKAVEEWPTPTSHSDVQSFIGLVNYYRRMIRNMAAISAPLTDVMSSAEKFTWGEPQEQAFIKLKEALTNAPLLALPDMSLPFIVQTDASNRAIGGILMQDQNGTRRVIAYSAKKLSQTERNWPTHERELFGFVHAFKTWRHYLAGSSVRVEGDHKPLTWIKTQKLLSPKQARWLSFLEEFTYTINYIPGKQLQAADAISRRPDLMATMEETTPDDRDRWVVHQDVFDAFIAPHGPFDYDAACQSDGSDALIAHFTSDFLSTNCAGKRIYANPPYSQLEAFMRHYVTCRDSSPEKTSAVFLLPMFETAPWFSLTAGMRIAHVFPPGSDVFGLPADRYKGTCSQDTAVPVGPVPFPVGVFVDNAPRPCNNAVSFLSYLLIEHPSELLLAVEDADAEADGEEWLRNNVQNDTWAPRDADDLPIYRPSECSVLLNLTELIQELRLQYETDELAQELLNGKQKDQFFLREGLIYYQSQKSELPVLYIPTTATELQEKILSESHDIPIAGHLSLEKTVERIQRHFYWKGLRTSVELYVKACDTCRKCKWNTTKLPGTHEAYPIPEYPWEVMAMDMKSGFPESNNGYNAVWVFVDKLTRRAHAIPCTTDITAAQLARLYFDHVFKHHGIPKRIVSDRDPRFISEFWTELWNIIGTKLNMSTTNHPQTDGSSENYIKTLSTMLRSFSQRNRKDWDRYLAAAEFAYNDSVHPATGFTPFQLDMGRNPMTPMQFMLYGVSPKPALFARDPGTDLVDPSVFLHRFSENLHMARQLLHTRQTAAQRQVLSGRTIPVTYSPGDYVYVQHPGTKNHLPTLEPRYIGPYEVQARVRPGVYRIVFPPYMRADPQVNEEKLKPYVDKHTGGQRPSPTPPAAPRVQASTEPRNVPPSGATRFVREHFTRSSSRFKVAAISDIRESADRNSERIAEVHIETSDGSSRWEKLYNVLKAKGNFRTVVNYLTQLSEELLQKHDPLFRVIRYSDEHDTMDAVVTYHDPAIRDGLYCRIVLSNGDAPDITEDDYKQYLADANPPAESLNALRMQCIRFRSQHRRALRILDLCSGTKSVSSAMRKCLPNAQIVTLDVDTTTNPTIAVDLMHWDYKVFKIGYFDIIWASPPCTEYSLSKSVGYRSLDTADALVRRVVDIIQYLKPKAWFIENPTGLLRHRPFMQHMEPHLHTCTYCHYGFPYRKSTDIWSNVHMHLRKCHIHDPCYWKMHLGQHPVVAQRGPSVRQGYSLPGVGHLHALYRVPVKLMNKLLAAALQHTNNR